MERASVSRLSRALQLILPPVAMATSATLAIPAVANQITAADDESANTVYVIGSRVAGRTESDVPVAVDVIGNAELRATGHSEVGRMIQALIPSFNFSSSSISDGTDAVRPATLRGLGPDQTLVLINGKRRHQGALVHINTSVGRGTSGVDLNAITIDAIERIEILRDGAAAQYGSDAIAGVINIVLKDGSEPGGVNLSYGQTNEGDGETWQLGVSKGIELENGFVNISYEFRDRGATNRAGESGVCQFSCSPHPTLAGVLVAQDSREISFERQNFRVGDAQVRHHSAVVNGAVDWDDDELYGFITLSQRENESAGFFRRANQVINNPQLSDGEAFYPQGYLPLITTDNDDYSFNVGYRTYFDNGIAFDAAVSHGKNSQSYQVSNSVNASWLVEQGLDAGLRQSAQTNAHSGELSLGLSTLNLDFTWDRESVAVAWGFEARRDHYQLNTGEEYSWRDYDGGLIGANAGIQVFPGFTPLNEVHESRMVYSVYGDAEWDVSDDWLITTALRYDDFEDFGSTLNLKLSARYSISDTTTLRGAFSTGFRAPSMQQQYFNNISTQFVDGQAVEVGTFRNDSQLAKDVGIPALSEEKSKNFSFGVAFEPLDNFMLTLDYYRILIDDRIVISDQIGMGSGSGIFDSGLAKNKVTGAQFFINGANTKTQGFDAVATYTTQLGQGELQLSVSANVTDTEVTEQFSPGGLNGIKPSDVFGAQGVSIIEEWQPKDRFHLTANYAVNNFVYNFSANRFGEYSVLDNNERQTYGAKWLTDVKMTWHYSQAMSFNAGINNLFDVTPDRNVIGQAEQGHIVDSKGQTLVNSTGVFEYSRRAAPFGFNGAYYYAGVNYRF
ncbi:MAG: TonB-dependent receptor plug domain-containing protein [Psychrobium sp.]